MWTCSELPMFLPNQQHNKCPRSVHIILGNTSDLEVIWCIQERLCRSWQMPSQLRPYVVSPYTLYRVSCFWGSSCTLPRVKAPCSASQSCFCEVVHTLGVYCTHVQQLLPVFMFVCCVCICVHLQCASLDLVYFGAHAVVCSLAGTQLSSVRVHFKPCPQSALFMCLGPCTHRHSLANLFAQWYLHTAKLLSWEAGLHSVQ